MPSWLVHEYRNRFKHLVCVFLSLSLSHNIYPTGRPANQHDVYNNWTYFINSFILFAESKKRKKKKKKRQHTFDSGFKHYVKVHVTLFETLIFPLSSFSLIRRYLTILFNLAPHGSRKSAHEACSIVIIIIQEKKKKKKQLSFNCSITPRFFKVKNSKICIFSPPV